MMWHHLAYVRIVLDGGTFRGIDLSGIDGQQRFDLHQALCVFSRTSRCWQMASLDGPMLWLFRDVEDTVRVSMVWDGESWQACPAPAGRIVAPTLVELLALLAIPANDYTTLGELMGLPDPPPGEVVAMDGGAR